MSIAVAMGNSTMITQLADLGANIRYRDDFDNSLLHIASLSQNPVQPV
jgi:ankyrin repeat protein